MARFFFDFSLTYVGAGMICSHLVNLSLLFGAVLSWGVMWPLLSKQEGKWYSAKASASSMTGLCGTRCVCAIEFSYSCQGLVQAQQLRLSSPFMSRPSSALHCSLLSQTGLYFVFLTAILSILKFQFFLSLNLPKFFPSKMCTLFWKQSVWTFTQRVIELLSTFLYKHPFFLTLVY